MNFNKKIKVFIYIFSIFLLLPISIHAQPAPICNTPANGSNWSLIGPKSLPDKGAGAHFSALGTGAQMRIKFQDADRPNPKKLYACTPSGGLFCTMDATAEMPLWENLTDSTRLPVLGVRDVGFVPGDSQTIFIGTGLRYPLALRRFHGIGVLKTTDGGKSWQQTGLQFTPPGKWNQVCHDLLVDPKNTNTVHALCGSDYYKSTDGGTHFTKKKTHSLRCPAGWGAAFRDIAFKPGDPNVVYLSTDHNFFFVSNDAGESWQEFDVRNLGAEAETDRIDIAVSPLNPELVFMACHTKKGEVIFRSLNAGADWKIVFRKKIRTSYERNDLVVSPNNPDVLYIGGVHIDRIFLDSTKRNSRTISAGIHADHRGLLAIDDGKGNDLLFSANDGGLYRGHLPKGKKRWEWVDISGTGMNNTQFYGIGVAEDYSVILGGTQDNGVLVADSTGRFFKPSLGGDGSDCAVDLFDTDLVYGSIWHRVPPEVWRSANKGEKFQKPLKKGINDGADTYYFSIMAHEDGYLYMGTKDVYRLPHKGEVWEQVGDIPLPNDLPYKILSIAVGTSDPNVIYAVGDVLYKTENANADNVIWKNISAGMGKAAKAYGAGGEMSSVTVDPADPDRVWVGIRNYGSPFKVYFSANGGTDWTAVSKGLPPFPVNDIVFQAGTKDAVYVGTDVGVFYNPAASDPNSEWLCFNSGLPVCLVTDLEINYCFNKIIAGTFGRSIWESPLANVSDFGTVEVNKNETWDFKIIRSDVVVESKATLTLKGEIRIASGKKIFLGKNSQLDLDGANLEALCGDTWGGIETKDDPNFFQRFFGGRPGTVEFKNGATIKNAILDVP